MNESLPACFPIIDCKGCSRTCGVKSAADFSREWLFAWARGEDLPECKDFQERYWKGQELARW